MSPFFRSILLACLLLPAPRVLHAHPGSDEAAIASIRAEFSRINALQLRREDYRYESSGCAEDGRVTYSLDGAAIRKVTESGSIGDGSWVREFYYQGGRVIFCYERLVGGPAAGPVQRTEHRFYIAGDRAIRCMEGSRIIPAGSDAAETVQTAYKLLKAHTSKDFATALCQ